MKHILLPLLAFFLLGCASFPLPHGGDEPICGSNSPVSKLDAVIELKSDRHADLSNEEKEYDLFLQQKNLEAINTLGCFKKLSVINSPPQNREKDIIYFELKSYFPNRKPGSFNQHLLSLFTLGIIPSWTTIRTDLKVLEYSPTKSEVELANYRDNRTLVLSILLAPLGMYQEIKARRNNILADDMTQIEVNKFLISKALKDLQNSSRNISQ